MLQGNAPEADIPDCLRFANVIRNNSPTTANNGRTPREKAAGRKLPINKRLLRGPMFCLVYAHVYEEERNKHEGRGVASVYLGYDDVNNAYKVKEWATAKIYFTADVTFHPRTFPYRADPNRSARFVDMFTRDAPNITVAIPQEGQIPMLRRSARQMGTITRVVLQSPIFRMKIWRQWFTLCICLGLTPRTGMRQ